MMDSKLQSQKNLVVAYLSNKGLEPPTIFEIIAHLAHSIFIDPYLNAFELKESLYRSNLPVIDLEEYFLHQIKTCLIMEGRKGLEYRLGMGFSYLIDQDKP